MTHPSLPRPAPRTRRFTRALAALALLVGGACPKSNGDPAPTHAPSPSTAAPAPSAHPGGLVRIDDDFEEAKRVAITSGKILFVDAWAPWCHTCWSMKRDVLHDPSLDAYADRVVFVELDTDRPQNHDFTVQYPVRNWPTFFAIDPANGAMLLVQGGSMSLPETRAFLDRALALRKGSSSPDDVAMADAYRLLQTGDVKGASAKLEQVASSPGPRRTEAVFAAVRALREAKDYARCTQVAVAGLDVVEGSASAGDLASFVLLCAGELPKDDPARAPAHAAAQKKMEQLVATPAPGAAVDDKADIMINLAGVYDELGRKDDAKKLHEARLKLMEDDAAASKTPEGARTHDYARMNSYLALGRGDEAVALFKQRVEQFPNDYESVARLASTLNKLGRYDEALPVAERAVALSYGPRKLGYLKLLADIRAKKHDVAGERAALTELVALNDSLAEKLRKPDVAAKAKARIAELDKK